jgi:hypothetical protein
MCFRYLILLLVCCYCTVYSSAQTISKINAAEYFFDKDPGAGKGIALRIGTSDTTINFTDSASLTGLQPGYHTLTIRVRNAQKNWSIFQTRTFFIGAKATEPVISKINAAEYFFDTDPGAGKGIALKVGTPDSVVNFADSAVVPFLPGKDHSLSVRVKNNSGKWSIYASWNFSFPATDIDRDGIVDYEEPGYGTDYRIFDTNGDGLADGINLLVGLPPMNTDTDGDGISNLQEIIRGTSPILADTDGDGVPDKQDAFPLDRNRTKLPTKNLSDHAAPVITLSEPPL